MGKKQQLNGLIQTIDASTIAFLLYSCSFFLSSLSLYGPTLLIYCQKVNYHCQHTLVYCCYLFGSCLPHDFGFFGITPFSTKMFSLNSSAVNLGITSTAPLNISANKGSTKSPRLLRSHLGGVTSGKLPDRFVMK